MAILEGILISEIKKRRGKEEEEEREEKKGVIEVGLTFA